MDSSDEEFTAALTKSAKLIRARQTRPRFRSSGNDKVAIKLNISLSSSDDEIEFKQLPKILPRPIETTMTSLEGETKASMMQTPSRPCVVSPDINSSVDELEAFFKEMKTPKRNPSLPSEDDDSFIVSDSDDIGGEEDFHHRATIDFNETTVLNPDPIYTDEDENEENNESIRPVEPFTISSDEFLQDVKKSAKKIKKKTEKLPKFTAGITPDGLKKLMRKNVRNELFNSPKTPKSPADKVMMKQFNRDFSPVRTPAKMTPVKTPTYKKSESTPCGFERCILYDVDDWSQKKYKVELSDLIEELYEILNRTVFNFGLPLGVTHRGDNVFRSNDSRMTIVWNKYLRSTAGRCRSGLDAVTVMRKCQVELAPHILDTASRLRDTLLHELVHAANWIIDEDPYAAHGPRFKKWSTIAKKTHPEIPPVKTTHSYEINFKYWWECENLPNGSCDVKVGRKSNSLRVDRVTCAKCGGKFIYVRMKYHTKQSRLKV